MGQFFKGFLKTLIFIFVLALAFIAALQYFGKIDVTTYFHREEAVNGIDNIAAKLTEKIDEGCDGSVSMYVSGVSEEELLKINYYIATLNGNVDNITSYMETAGVTKVIFEIVRSDNSFVYDCIKNQAVIPDDKVTAKELYNKVSDILNQCISSGMTDYTKEQVLHDYLVLHCDYSFGSDANENEYRAYGALCEGEAVCNGYAEAMALLLSCAGVENEFITGYADGVLHAWNLVKIDGEWYHLDATWDDPISSDGNKLLHTYFNVDDEVMELRHSWNKASFRSCTSMDANYFKVNHTYYSDYNSFVNASATIAQTYPDGEIECAISNYDKSAYSLDFFFGINGVKTLKFATDGGGDYTVLSIYLNR